MSRHVTNGPRSAAALHNGAHVASRVRAKPVRAAALLLTALALAALLGLRLYGDHRFAVVPEPLPAPTASDGTPLASAVDTLLERSDPVGSPSAFVSLGDAHRALLARLALIGLATRRIDIQYYLLEDDEVGRALLERLREAAAHGVEVRLLLDDIDLVGREQLLARLAADEPQLTIRVFNPTWLRRLRPLEYIARFPRANRRMHNKALVVDGVAAVVGGRNIGNGYFDIGDEPAFEDLDVLAVGRVAGDVAAEFDAYWHSGLAFDISALAEPADEPRRAAWRKTGEAALGGYLAELDKRDDIAGRRLVDGTLEAWSGTAQVLYDSPDKVTSRLGDTDGNLAPRILELIGSANTELVLSSPYLIPGEQGMAVFRTLRERGVRVRVLTNSFAANDVAAVHAGYRDYRGPLLELGVELHEFMPGEGAGEDVWNFLGSSRTSLHAKAFVIDGERSFVGSYNLDPRSALHNTEMGLLIDSEAFARQLHARLVDALDERAWTLVANTGGGLEWHGQDGDGNAVVHLADPGTLWPQRALVWLASWLPIDWLL